MGCSNSKKAPAKQAAPAAAAPEQPNPVAVPTSTPSGDVQIFGIPGSMNSLGAVIMSKEYGIGKMTETMPGPATNTPEFVAMNPWHQIPTMKDKEYCLAESSAILRYLATTYAPDLFPKDPKRAAFADWAMDRFVSKMAGDIVACVFPLLGFAAAPADQEAAGKTAATNLQEFADVFLKEKFIGGEKPCLADYKVAPFFVAMSHPATKKISLVEVPARILAFNKDFADTVKATAESVRVLKEFLDKKEAGEILTTDAAFKYETGLLEAQKPAGKGQVKIYGAPVSVNSLTAILFANESGVGEMELTLPGEATNTPEFLKMNPFHAIPTLRDGDFCLAESSSILRYMASNYAVDFYPADSKKRGFIDWAMDSFGNTVFGPFTKVVYPCLGFMEMPEDFSEAVKSCTAALEAWAAHFLKEKFIGGAEQLSIGDFKAAPFFFALGHPFIKEKTGLVLPERIIKFNQDFGAAAKSSKLLSDFGGNSIAEFMDSASAKVETKEVAQVQAVMQEEDVSAPVLLEPHIEDKAAPICGCFS